MSTPMGDFLKILWDNFSQILTIATPLIIAWYGWKVQTSQKESDRYKKAREKIEDLERAERERVTTEQNTAIGKLSQKVDAIESAIDKLNIDTIDRKMDSIVDLVNATFQYSQSLSKVVTCLGDAIEGASTIETTGKIRNEIEKHRSTEREIIARLCKVKY